MTLITAIVVLNWWLTRSIRTLDLGFIIMIGFLMQEILRPGRRAEKWAMALAWWIPRKYRGTIVGDILEDCQEMRERGCGEWRIRIQVLWQWAIAIGTLVPAAMIATVWRILSPLK
jgi:hypothetical protein